MTRAWALAWAWVRRLPGNERTADLLLWAVLTGPVFLFTHPDPATLQPTGLPLPWGRIAAVPLLGLAVFVSRQRPLAAAAVPAALGLAATPELFTNALVLAQVVLAYLLGRRSSAEHQALLFFGAVYATGLLLVVVVPGASMSASFSLAGNLLLAFVLPWLVGRYARRHAELVRTGWELAERLEREQALVGDRVRLRERSRIAGDMHDSLGHELSLIALRAAALQVAPDVGAQGRQAARDLRQAAAAATERLHEIIGVLREDSEGAPVAPAGDTVTALVAQAAASGMTVTLTDRLTAPADGTDPAAVLPPMTDRAAYRVVQEALTNATKHAPGAAVLVTLGREETEAVVTVVNEAPPLGLPTVSPVGNGGHGLVGLDERVRLAGGTLRAQPSDGGFTVTARLPLTPGAAVTPPGAAGASRRELDLVRRKVRRSMIDAIWVPVAAGAVLLTMMFGYNLYTSYRSVLDDEVYRQLHVGQPQSAVQDRLPAYEADDNQRPEEAPADPPGTDRCRFYRTNALTLSPAYRLCFTAGRLTHKDRVDVTR